MTESSTRWVDPNPPDPVDSRMPMILVVTGAALTLAVVLTLVLVVVFHGGDDAEGPTLALVPTNAPLKDPFTRSILVAPVTISSQTAAQSAALLQQLPVRVDRGVRLTSGRQPQLYGAIGETAPCDVVTLANLLDSGPGVAQLWGLALGVTSQQVPHYLNTLTAVVLMADTWVTSFTLTGGSESPRQSVLQAGTAVLIDPIGVPRVQCASGSPLAPPANADFNRYRVNGTAWQGFSPQTTVAVAFGAQGAPPGDDFVLVDVSTGQPVNRKPGGSIDLGSATVALPDPAVMNVPSGAPPVGVTAPR